MTPKLFNCQPYVLRKKYLHFVNKDIHFPELITNMKSFFYRCEVFTPLPGTIGTLQFHVSNLLLSLKIVKKQYHALMILYSFRYETFSCGFKVV